MVSTNDFASAADSAQLHSVLESSGVRATDQRLQILALISARPGTFTAEDVSESMPGVGRATVYRTLRLLQDSGAICKVVMPDGAQAYSIGEAETDDAHHHHAVCTKCGSVRDFSERSIERAIDALGALDDLGEVVGHRIEVYDVCRDCG